MPENNPVFVRRTIRQQNADAALELHKLGWDLKSIAEALGLSEYYVRILLYSVGVSLKKPREKHPRYGPIPLSSKKRQRNIEICKMYESGRYSSGQLAEEYNITRERVCQILRLANLIELRTERRLIAKEIVASERAAIKAEEKARLDRAIQLIKEGKSAAEAAYQTGIGPGVLQYHAKGLSKHGRWRDFSARKARFIELRKQGLATYRVIAIMRDEGEMISPSWAHRHCREWCHRILPVEADSPGETTGEKPPSGEGNPEQEERQHVHVSGIRR